MERFLSCLLFCFIVALNSMTVSARVPAQCSGEMKCIDGSACDKVCYKSRDVCLDEGNKAHACKYCKELCIDCCKIKRAKQLRKIFDRFG